MPVLQNDPGIREAPFSLEEKLTIQQVRFVGARFRNLLVWHETASRSTRLRPIKWGEWSDFVDAAYSCGFVCNDSAEGMGDREKTLAPEFIRRLEGDLGTIQTLCLCNLRRILNGIVRSERWSDGGASTGGSAVLVLITSRLGNAVAGRLGG
ncbi:hypothetical protein GCM10011363_42860 [Marivita lacus]|uniref:Uncharacterized protein n=1 Tax=Marivita lacus TaxID=1323742 RepID=A0ABQ1L9Y7_9RHOB|nr:hypothetical protein [Marivita lacus]GGC21639.1 hypothetical protein GCM10011363_42860 [Marivita lacus]